MQWYFKNKELSPRVCGKKEKNNNRTGRYDHLGH